MSKKNDGSDFGVVKKTISLNAKIAEHTESRRGTKPFSTILGTDLARYWRILNAGKQCLLKKFTRKELATIVFAISADLAARSKRTRVVGELEALCLHLTSGLNSPGQAKKNIERVQALDVLSQIALWDLVYLRQRQPSSMELKEFAERFL